MRSGAAEDAFTKKKQIGSGISGNAGVAMCSSEQITWLLVQF